MQGVVETEVYVDLYFLVNASMDLLCLAMTASILHRAVKRWRLFLAALLGGGWAVGVLLLGIDGAPGVVPDLLMAVLLAAVAFAEKNGRITRLLRDAGAYALLSALLGGLMTVLYRFLNRLELPLEALQGDGLSAWMFAILAAVAPDRLVIVTKKDRVTANDLVALSPLGGTAGGYDALIASE